MSKKTNTLLFILGGTVFNIIVTIICFILFLLIYFKFLQPRFPENATGVALPIIFVLSIVVSFLVYRVVIKIVMKKVDMEKYFDPIFGPRRPPRKQ
ncbi:MAG: leader peptide processing enzyme [Treponema sp.]|nr:leader peptide processing enzyme [Treponema sp.]